MPSKGHLLSLKYEPPHDKTNKMTFALREDSDQPGHTSSLISLRCPHEETLATAKTDYFDMRWLILFLTAFSFSVRFSFMIFNVAQSVNCYTRLMHISNVTRFLIG